MKNATRSKFMLCFRPVVDMDSLVLDSGGGSRKSQRLKYQSTQSGSSMSDNDQCSKSSDENLMMVRPPLKRSFSHAVKAVMFETVLAKRARNRKSLSQESHPSKCHFSRRKSLDISEDDKSVKLVSVDHGTDIQETKSNPELLSSQSSVGSSSSSSCSTSSISESKTTHNNHQERVLKQTQKPRMGYSSSFICVISLLLMSLAVTILWGRICAILFTSMWLYFIPELRARRPEDVKKIMKQECRDYKKRIIIEGLIERNHHKEGCI